MFRKMEIKRFGVFQDFVWKNSVGANETFKQLNLIYGRNYSGKTTLSRIFRSMEDGHLPHRFEGAEFTVVSDEGQATQNNLSIPNQLVRVYNRDFAKENLSFLVDETTGVIRPFAVVGAVNNALEERIKLLQGELGVDDNHGLRKQLAAARTEAVRMQGESGRVTQALDERLRREAAAVKGNRNYGKVVYTIDTIRSEIASVTKNKTSHISDDEKAALLILLKEDALDEISAVGAFESRLPSLSASWATLLGRKITPTKPLQDLLNDAALQAWVKAGIPLHKEKRESCGFCGGPLPAGLWVSLADHFNQESTLIESEIQAALESFDSEAKRLRGWLQLPESQFYASLQVEVIECKRLFNEALEGHISDFSAFRSALEQRLSNVFTPIQAPAAREVPDNLTAALGKIGQLIEENNRKALSLPKDKVKASDKLRLNAVLAFKDAVGYDAALENGRRLAGAAQLAAEAADAIQKQRDDVELAIVAAKAEQNDESAAATRVNDFLHRQFGHTGLRLVAGERQGVAFSILRGEAPAFNLSEGECSLIAFCYFLAKLEDTNTQGRSPVVYIDDPISSLDSNHIFFLFSLIEENITSSTSPAGSQHTCRYPQVFISTHNLDFFKYMKCLSHPKNEQAFFLIERGKGHSQLRLMPSYMKKYQTEFVYLFHQVYLCQDEPKSEADHERFYSFGNNLRKFLEAYLFFKYPFHGENQAEKLTRFFGSDASAVAVTTRVSNELSHLQEIFDRSMRPVEVPEIPALAKFVIDRIREKDPDQCEALLRSIGGN
jgi:wobble nucleotide-excising tRNase